jgi:PAS domain S-box-containing protein
MAVRLQENLKIKLAFGFTFAMLLVVGVVSYRLTGIFSERDRWVRHTYKVLSELQELRFAEQTIKTTTRAFSLTGDESEIGLYRAAVASAEQHRAAIGYLTMDNPVQQRQLPALERLEAERVQTSEAMIGVRRTDGLAAVADYLRTGPSRQISDSFREIVDQMDAEELRLLAAREGFANLNVPETKAILVVGTLLGLVAIAAGGWTVLLGSLKRMRAEEALRESEARLDRAQAVAGIGSWELELATGRTTWSKELYRILGVSSETYDPSVDKGVVFVHPDDHPEVRRWMAALAAGIEQGARETRHIRSDGQVRLLRVDGRPMIDADGVIRRLVGTMQDVTDRRATEQQLTQARKMEAIGNLTGGMAHDFNNSLGVIVGNLDLLGRLVKADEIATELCDEARDGALRCADRIRLLLAFARQQPLHPQRTDVNTLTARMAKLFGRTLQGNITLTLNLDATLCPAVADPAQLEAALINLANNARDAMPGGGHLGLATKIAELDEHYAGLHSEVNPGMYVLIEISDTGTGIAPDVIDHIFEPFFTTKNVGAGTGLGLSMVFGFAQQSGGHLVAYSELGLGSTFRLYLPRAPAGDAESAEPADRRPVIGGRETVLLVDDNASLLLASARQLTGLGYQVRKADHAVAALAVLDGDGQVDLLLTDVVMPGTMDGLDLAYESMRLRPRLKVLLTSGFSSLQGASQRMADCPFHLLDKPYSHDKLARAVRAILDSDKEQAFATAQPAQRVGEASAA